MRPEINVAMHLSRMEFEELDFFKWRADKLIF